LRGWSLRVGRSVQQLRATQTESVVIYDGERFIRTLALRQSERLWLDWWSRGDEAPRPHESVCGQRETIASVGAAVTTCACTKSSSMRGSTLPPDAIWKRVLPKRHLSSKERKGVETVDVSSENELSHVICKLPSICKVPVLIEKIRDSCVTLMMPCSHRRQVNLCW
jgi:hypothetical protein